ncbi:hypothetical protein HNQ60_000093 [Povalibacter uvarum]|uniref:Uncharacterized protein n=1 Tax=Povalibacter uvarum TaxID=732238 RepID=A0A841HEH0_9GAMM|nr:hypothetical protein [Povalibacter uvarum]MBB6091247.1 hypothetical protein [Povalibacter uvarum]
MDTRKQAVSIRMNAADIRNVKKLARRLGVRDSDIIRFAIKVMLGRLAPLYDLQVRGKNLVPVFVESGTELFRHFELDAMRLDSIINEGADEPYRVDPDDIQLIAMSGIQRSYARLRLSSIRKNDPESVSVRAGIAEEEEELGNSLRRYLYEKYVYRAPNLRSVDEPRSSLEMESQP